MDFAHINLGTLDITSRGFLMGRKYLHIIFFFFWDDYILQCFGRNQKMLKVVRLHENICAFSTGLTFQFDVLTFLAHTNRIRQIEHLFSSPTALSVRIYHFSVKIKKQSFPSGKEQSVTLYDTHCQSGYSLLRGDILTNQCPLLMCWGSGSHQATCHCSQLTGYVFSCITEMAIGTV